MATSNRPKVDLKMNEAATFRLLKDRAYEGESSVGKYFLYSVLNISTNEEQSFFAPQAIHDTIVQQGLKSGSEFILKKVESKNGNGRAGWKLEFSLVGKSASPEQTRSDNLRDIMLQSIQDAEYVVGKSGIQFSNDELQKFATTMFIARAKQSF